jgi:hypothetical protein
MVHLTPAERVYIDDLLACLAAAIDRRGDVPPEYANKTKLQKLLYLAIEEFNLPLTYSWYLAGSVIPNDPATTETLAAAGFNISPTGPSIDETQDDTFDPDASITAGDRFEDETTDTGFPKHPDRDRDGPSIDPVLFIDSPSSGTFEDDDPPSEISLLDHVDSREDVIDFYVEILPTVWHQTTMRFLQNFYRDHAPDKYRSLYLTSIHLRTHLLDAEDAVHACVEGEQPTRSLADIANSIRMEVSDLHYYLRANDELADTLDAVVEGTTIIEDVFMLLEQAEPEELTHTHKEAIETLQDFFYYHVWRYPCLIISRETATGPRAEKLGAERNERLESFERELKEQCKEVRATLAEVELVPQFDDFPPVSDDDITEKLSTLSKEYFQQ